MEQKSYYLINYGKSIPNSGDGNFSYSIEKMAQLSEKQAEEKNTAFAYIDSKVRYVPTQEFQALVAPDKVFQKALKREAEEDTSWMEEWEEDNSCEDKCDTEECKKEGCRKKKG